MRLRGKLLALFTSILTVCTLVGTAFSLWFFNGDIGHGTVDVTQNMRVDDIEENYLFGKPKEDVYYDIYVFPSTLYYFINQHKPDSVKLEDKFGYLEVKQDNNGNLIKDSSGNVQYTLQAKKPTENSGVPNVTNNYFGDNAYNEYIKVFDSTNETYMSYSATNDVYNYFQNHSDGSDSDKYYARPNESHDSAIESPDVGYNEDPGYRTKNPHKRDRLGVWEEREFGTGRCLPIKITVKNSLKSSVFNSAILTPYTSMCDAGNWFDFRHTAWYPLPRNASDVQFNSSSGYQTIRNPFQAMDINNYFSVNRNLARYVCDEYQDTALGITRKIIRLLPTYSNSKNKADNDNPSISRGGRDGLKVTVSSNGRSDIKHFATYLDSSTSYNINDYAANGIKVATFPAINIDSNTTNINVRAAIALTDNDGQVKAENTFDGWPTTQNVGQSAIQSLLNTYGDGLYRIYVFVGNSGLKSQVDHCNSKYQTNYHHYFINGDIVYDGDNYRDLPTDKSPDYAKANFQAINARGTGPQWMDYYANTKSMQLNTTSKLCADILTDNTTGIDLLKGKELIQFDESSPMFSQLGTFITGSNPTSVPPTANVNRHCMWGARGDNNGSGLLSWIEDWFYMRPVEIAFEKIRTVSLLSGVHENYSYDQHKQEVASLMEEAPSMFRENKNTLFRKSDIDNNIKNNALNRDHDHTYGVKSIDFRYLDSDSRTMQYYLSNTYRGDFNFNLNPAESDVVLLKDITDSSTVNSSSYTYFDRYEPAGRYFDLVTKSSWNNEVIIKMKSQFVDDGGNTRTLSPGIFDFIVTKSTASSSTTYDIYCRRHMNIFVKLFKDDLTNRTVDNTIDHEHPNPNNPLLWRKQYGIGEDMNPADLNELASNNTLQQACASIVGNNNTGLKLIDHVSKARVGYYQNGVLTINLNIAKNYILYTEVF